MSDATLRAADKKLLRALMDERNPEAFAAQLFAYYRDRDRADRTSREQMYLHLGMCAGQIVRAAARGRRSR